MASIQLTVKQFAALCTRSNTPPWQLKIQPGQPKKPVSLKGMISQVSETSVIVFAALRNWTIFRDFPGVISPIEQQYIFDRTCLSGEDLTNLITALGQNNLELVYVSPTMQSVGIRGTIGNLTAMNLAVLGQITNTGNTLTSSTNSGPGGMAQTQAFLQGLGKQATQALAGPLAAAAGGAAIQAGRVWAASLNMAMEQAGNNAYAEVMIAAGDAANAEALAAAAAASAELAEGAALGLVTLLGPIGLVVAGAGLVAVGAYLTFQYLKSTDPAPPVSTPVTVPSQAIPPTAPSSVPQGIPVVNPVPTNPPTYGPQPVELRPDLISSAPYTTSVVASNGFPGGPDTSSPPYPNTYAGLLADNGAGYLANPWARIADEVSINVPPQPPTGTGPALTSSIQGNGPGSTLVAITNPATGIITTLAQNINGDTNTIAISDSGTQKTTYITTVVTSNQTTNIATAQTTLSVGAYSPTWLPTGAGGGGGTTGTGGSSGTGGTGTGETGTGGLNWGTAPIGTGETGTGTGTGDTDSDDSIIIGGTGVGSGS